MKTKFFSCFLIKACALTLFLSMQFTQSHASHAMGADITYTSLGNNQYEITFSFYRDCSGIPVQTTTGDITIINSCGYPTQTVTLALSPSSPTQISAVCNTAVTTCNGGTSTGIEEYIYSGTITLPGPCADWTVYHSENARNAAITTITTFGDLFVYSVINNTNAIVNTSPIFSNRPVTFACAQQQFCYNHGAYDAEGDSLSYELITPRSGPTAADTVQYANGYSYTQPFSGPPMVFNTSTGDFCIEPAILDVSILAIVVSEWRNGVLIGQVERDIQVTVNACTNNLPSLTGINGLPSHTVNACVGEPVSFWIASSDLDPGNMTTITWDNSIAGANFLTSGGHRDSAFFSWIPTAADLNFVNCFTALVTDDACPYLGVNAYAYCINVNDCNDSALITGNVFADLNADCIKDANETGLSMNLNQPWIVKAVNNSTSYYQVPDTAGFYEFHAHPGTYDLSVVPPDTNFVEVCPGNGYSVTVQNADDTIPGNNFTFNGPVSCIQLFVSVTASPFRPCMQNQITVDFGNTGTANAQYAYAVVNLPPELTIDSCSIPYVQIAPGQYSFSLGQVNAGADGVFYITAHVDCNASALLNATLCITADISPEDFCGTPSPLWDHSNIRVTAECRDSLSCFTIKNTGPLSSGDMQQASQWRLYADNILSQQGTFQLIGGDVLELCFPSTGQTFRLEADQNPGHPGNSMPRASIERCGTGVTYSLNELLGAPLDNGLSYHNEYCAVVRTSYDPNDKAVVPQGIGPNHYISRNDVLEYIIRFQNTGNDTAFNVVIVDSLDRLHLDLGTIQNIESSHPNTFSIGPNGVLTWTFNNILLPDSNVNEAASHGYVRFSAHQNQMNPFGSRIENTASIKFDFNSFINTNTVFNRVEDVSQIDPFAVVLTLNHQPYLCAGDSITISANLLPAAIYTWYKDGVLINGASSNSYTASSPGNYSVVAASPFDTAASTPVAVYLFAPVTQPGSINGITNVLEHQSGVNYTVPAVPGATSYIWHLPAGASIASGHGTNSVVINFGNQSGAIEVAAVNACGASTFSSLNVAVTPTGVGEIDFDGRFELYPNPVVNNFTLRCNITGMVQISLYSIDGKLMQNLFNGKIQNKEQKNFSVKNFANGNYFLQINTETSSVRKAIIINN